MNIQELVDLLKKYQNTSTKTDEKNQIITQIIAQLSSCYWWHSQYIINLFPEDIQRIKQELTKELENRFQIQINEKLHPQGDGVFGHGEEATNDGSCSTWGNPKTGLPPLCPMPHAAGRLSLSTHERMEFPAAFDKNFDFKELSEFLLEEALILQKKYQKELITDKFINTLAIQVKQTQANSFQRKQAVQCLIKAMNTKNTYKKQGLGTKLNLSSQDYKDAFEETKGESIRYVLDNIDKYDEKKGDFMALINYWISLKFSDAAGRILGIKKSQVNKQEEDKIIISTADPHSIKDYFYENADQEFAYYQKSEEIKNLIKADPNNKLGKPIRKDRNDIRFKDVLIAVNWEGETFKNLSRKWDIPYTTIKSFYEREFQQVKADLADYLQ